MKEQDNDIFKIIDLVYSDGKAEALLSVNGDSEILRGHFPGQPVVPGACMLQLVKDVLETMLKGKLQMKEAQQIKFMNMVVPGDDQLKLSISFVNVEDNSFAAQASLTNNETICFKFHGIFVKN